MVTTNFPMQYLSTLEIEICFTHASMARRNEPNEVIIAAIVRIYQNRRYIISTASSIELFSPYITGRWRACANGYLQLLTVPAVRPNVINLYWSTASRIDRHNRCRKDDICIGKKIRTHWWVFRMSPYLFSTILVDAWLLLHRQKGDIKRMNQNLF